MDGTIILMRNRKWSVNWLIRLYLCLFTNLTDAEQTKFLPWQKIRNLLLDSVTGSQVKTAGSRSETQADQIISRALKFLKSVSNDDLSYEEVTENAVTDFYLGSGCNISEFIENLETRMEMGHSGQLGYINAPGDLIDYRKYQGVTPQVLQNFSVVEMLIRRARRCI